MDLVHSRDRTQKSKVTQKAEVRSSPQRCFQRGYLLFGTPLIPFLVKGKESRVRAAEARKRFRRMFGEWALPILMPAPTKGSFRSMCKRRPGLRKPAWWVAGQLGTRFGLPAKRSAHWTCGSIEKRYCLLTIYILGCFLCWGSSPQTLANFCVQKFDKKL